MHSRKNFDLYTESTVNYGWLTLDRAGIICAGYDEINGGEVYSIPLGGSLHKQPYAIAGSGSTVWLSSLFMYLKEYC